MTTIVRAGWDQARAAVASLVRPLAAEEVPLAQAAGLVLAQEVVALTGLPSFDSSAMDGWAICGPGPWLLVGAAMAGHPWAGRLERGTAVEIATGAVVPAGADAVIRSEDGIVAAQDGAFVLSAARPAGRTHIRAAGQECQAGDVLVRAGVAMTPPAVGLAAAVGYDRVSVIPRPKVGVALFGDELVPAGLPSGGQIRDSVGPQLPGWLRAMGADVVSISRGSDSLASHLAAIAQARRGADLVLTTGGTAVGPGDHLRAAIRELGGHIVVDGVAVRPGRPMLAATVGSGPLWIIGLPGNPLSAAAALLTLGAPILAGLAGRDGLPQLASVATCEELAARHGDERLIHGTVREGQFFPGAHQGSAMLRGLACATGFAVVPAGPVPVGGSVRWLPLPV